MDYDEEGYKCCNKVFAAYWGWEYIKEKCPRNYAEPSNMDKLRVRRIGEFPRNLTIVELTL